MEAQKHQSSGKGRELWGLFLLREHVYTLSMQWGSCSPLLGFLSNVLDHFIQNALCCLYPKYKIQHRDRNMKEQNKSS